MAWQQRAGGAGPRPRLLMVGRGLLRAAHIHFPSKPPPLEEVRDLEIPSEHGPLRTRLYRPTGDAALPGMVFFHGGGFFFGDIETHDEMCRWLSALAGALIVSVDYRLAPENRFPAQMQDAEAAAYWTVRNTGNLGIDPTRLALGGDSAGAYLAAATAAGMNHGRPGLVALQVLIYPLFHIDERACRTEASLVFRLAGRTAAGLVQRQVMQPGETAPSLGYDEIVHAPPTLLISGGRDPLRAEATAYAQALRQAGITVTEIVYPSLLHGGLSFPSLSKVNLTALIAAGEALRIALSPPVVA